MTWGFQNTFDQSAQECADAIAIQVSDNIDGVMSGQLNFADLAVKLGPDDEGPSAVSGMGSVGGFAGVVTSPQVSYLVRKLSQRGGRRGRGRMYFPGVAEATVGEDGLVTSVRRDALQVAFNTFLADLAAITLPMYLLHDPSGPDVANPTGPGAPDEVTSLVVDNLVATQRRRLRG